jgi:hypothetical protein
MSERNSNDNGRGEEADLEKRLKVFYGPPLQEQPLPTASWEHLRQQLGPRKVARHRFHWRIPRRPSQRHVPQYIHEAFARIAYEARGSYPSSMLRCLFKADLREAGVRVSFFGRPRIKLLFPFAAIHTPGSAELDVLLATGLARYVCMRKRNYAIAHFLIATLVLLPWLVLILFLLHGLSIVIFPIAISLCIVFNAVALWRLHVQGQRLAFRADSLVVLWLGRGTACRGLHALADLSPAPHRRRWGEPSLVERIERVCGTRVETQDDRVLLTR